MSGRAVFLDRDGTLVEARHYPSRPEELVLCAGVGPELLALQHAGFRLAVITNQSGIARGYLTEADLEAMHLHLRRELAAEGVWLDAIYACPHHPEGTVAPFNIDCDCRKPAPGMLLRGATELDVDLTRSWVVGDILDDVEAGNRAGCRAVLVDLGTEHTPESALRAPAAVARDTCHALRIIRAVEGIGPPAALDYRPRSWHGASPSHRLVPATTAREEVTL